MSTYPKYLQSIVDRLKSMPPEERAKILAAAQADPRKWLPNPGQQTKALRSLADELFFGGVPGPGKSSLAVGCAVNEHSKSIIFRREYTQVKGLEDEAAKILGSRDGYNSTLHLWRLPGPDNKTLEFGSVPSEHDREKWQGQAHDYIAFDEIAAFLRSQYRYLTLWNRSTVPGQRCRIVCTGNPPQTAEGLWVIAHWAPWLDKNHHDPAEDGELRYPIRFSPTDDREHFFRTAEEAVAFLESEWPPEHVPRDDQGVVIPPRSRSFIAGDLNENLDLVRDNAYRAVLAFADAGMQSLVKGQFDSQLQDHANQVIPTQWVEEAQKRWTERPPQGVPMTALGADIAQGGPAKTVLSPRHDHWFARLIAVPGAQTPRAADAAALIVQHRRDNCAVAVDASGGYGGPVAEWLEINNGVSIVRYKGGTASGSTLTLASHV
jgi:hypothetical protein